MPRGRTASPPLGNTAKAAVMSSGVTTPVPSESEGTSGRSRRPTSEASRSTGREPTRCCSAVAARLLDSISAARSVSASGVSPRALRGAHSSGPCGAMLASPSSTVTGVKPCSSAAAKSSGLNAEPGWRRLRQARLNCEVRKSRPPTIARMSPVRGSIATSAAWSSGALKRASPSATARSAASCSSGTNEVRTSQSGGWSPPKRSRNCWRRNSFA